MTMPDTTETRDGRITETITFKFDDEAQQKRFHERLKVGDEKISILEREIERLSRELQEAKEALVHYDHFLIDLTEDFIGSFDGAELQDMLVANGLYVIEDFDPAKHHDWSGAAEPGDNFYTPSDVVLKARSVLSPKKEVSRERETG